jgi:hypothetical protein
VSISLTPEQPQHYGRSPVRPVGPRYAKKRTKAKWSKSKAKARRVMQGKSRRRNRK